MKVCYPFRNTNGQEFRQQDEVIRLITGEAHGTWLLGTNGLWHGGIHISDISAPFSAFNPDAVNSGDPVPLQFMTDGTLVAYRVNDAYLNAPYCDRPLRYSSTFALVKSVCKPDPEKEATWLEFYSLYMHLAPIADYPLSPCYKVNDGHNNITLRQYSRGEYGVPEGDESGTGCAAPHPIARKLKSGDRVVVSRTGRFYVSQRHESVLMTFGLARMVDGNKIGDEQFWVTLDPELMVPDGEIAELMPEWMHQAREKGTFNEVVVTDGSDCWTVTAGTPLGFLGCMESPGTGAIIAEKEWCAHLEVLSVDPSMQNFLANSQSVTSGKHYVIAQKGKALSIRCGETGHYTFKAGIAKLGQQVIIARDEANPTQDPSGKWWFNIMGGGWLSQEDISEAGQYDLMKLGFMPLEENTAGDQTDTPFESWVPEVFGRVSRAAEQGHSNQYSLVPKFYRDVLDKMGQDGKISGEEIRCALTIRDPLVRDVVSRMVVKHHSEWFGGRSTGRWDGFYKMLGPLETGYCEKWQVDLEWMSKVPPFNQDSAIWHMHPVVFLDALNESEGGRCQYLFSKISGVILRHEGGYVNDPDDKGGETNMGITLDTWKKFAPEDLGIQATSKSLKEMTKEQAETIYYNHYWKPKGFCKLENTKVALMIYDWTITSGLAVKQIRKLLHGEYDPRININNSMDDDMIHCVNNVEGQEQLLNRIAEVRKDYYRSLTITDGKQNSQVKFLKGWINRVDDCLKVVI
ncbi:glycoside hydrolase family 108 protein [Enterobacter asburiae]|uniref:glycoside hydrolase family 108 protein n=1 Tax=Enterobacter asburiae TaxID=61645 RepID=UPI003F5566C2